jgi:hypothetical protein
MIGSSLERQLKGRDESNVKRGNRRTARKAALSKESAMSQGFPHFRYQPETVPVGTAITT